MAGDADESSDVTRRQQCIDVLCGTAALPTALRRPLRPPVGDETTHTVRALIWVIRGGLLDGRPTRQFLRGHV